MRRGAPGERTTAPVTRLCRGKPTAAVAMMVIGTAVLAACGGSSPSGSSVPAASSSSASSGGGGGVVTVPKGQEMKASNGETVSVTGIVTNYPNGYGNLTPGDQCIKVTLSINNGSKGDWGYPQSELTVMDASGKSHPAAGSGQTCPGSVGPLDLPAGHSDDGVRLTYEVPSSGALLLKWSPALLQGESYETPLQ